MHTTVIDCVKFVAGVARKALVSAYEVFILRGLVSFVIWGSRCSESICLAGNETRILMHSQRGELHA